MYIYLDFEAHTQSHEISSIGAVAEDGTEFYSLVRTERKPDRYTIEITGITPEQNAAAKRLDEVMESFDLWLRLKPKGEGKTFLVWGDFDAKLLSQASRKYYPRQDKKCFRAIQYVRKNIKRVDKVVARKFGRDGLGLYSAYLTMSSSPVGKQRHNALDDARMLKYVWEHFDTFKLRPGETFVKVDKKRHKSALPEKYNRPVVALLPHNTKVKVQHFDTIQAAYSAISYRCEEEPRSVSLEKIYECASHGGHIDGRKFFFEEEYTYEDLPN